MLRKAAAWEPYGVRIRRNRAVPGVRSSRVPASEVMARLRRQYPPRVLRWVRGAEWHRIPDVPLERIRMARRPGGRSRDGVRWIEEAVRAGKPIEPVVLVETPRGLLLADGYHRTLAYRHLGKRTIPAYVALGACGFDHAAMHAAKGAAKSMRLVLSRSGRLRKAAPVPAGAHWITIHPERYTHTVSGEPTKGRHVLIDGEGRILGGSLPKAAQGRKISDWWREQKAPEPHLHQHLQAQGTAYAHHEDRTLQTGHGYQEARDKWGRPDAAPGHVRAFRGSQTPPGYVALGSAFADKDRVKALGGRWGPSIGVDAKRWYLPVERLPRLLREFSHATVDASAHDAYQDWAEQRAQEKPREAPSQQAQPKAPEPAKATEVTPEPFAMPEGVNREAMAHGDLHNYQKAGVRFLLESKRAILGHGVGLGKTIQSIIAAKIAQQKEGAGPFLILCPSSRKYGWADEIERFAPGTKAVVLDASLSPKRQAERWAQAESEKPDFIITNYETLQKPELAEKLHALAPNVIADEAHKVKNRKAKTTAGFGAWKDAKYAWLLTATPMPNGQPEETYTMLSHVMPNLGSWSQFGRDHVVFEDVRTAFGTVRKPVRLKNVGTLREKIKRAVQIKSMTDPDVGLQLPDRRRVDVSLDMTKDQQRMYDDLAEEIAGEVEGMSQEAYEQAAASIMVKLKRLEQIAIDPDLVRAPEDRKGDLSPKESWAVETIADHLEDPANRGVVLFADLRLPLDKIRDALKGQGVPVAMVTGSQSPAERQQTERDFGAGKVQVVLATSAAEEGMNLQHGGHTMIHLDAPWVPKSLTQREGRIHRQGQPSPFTTHYHVTARNSVEARKQSVVHGKARTIDELLGTHGAEDMAVGRAMTRAEVLRMLRGEQGAPSKRPRVAKSVRASRPDPARRLVLTNGVEGGSEMQSSRRIRRAGAGHQGGALVLWSRRRMRRSNQSPLPATEDCYTQAGAVWPPSEPVEEQEPLAIRRQYADGSARRLNPQAEQAELAKRSRRPLARAIGISILESRTARATRGRDPRGRYLHHGRMRKSARPVILGRDGRRRPGGAVRARSTRPGPEEHASRRWPRKNLVLGRYRHGTDRQAREQGSGWRRDQESSAQVLGALTASRRANMPGTTPIPRPSGKPAVVALKSRSMEDAARALAAYRRLLHSSSSPAAALQRLAQGYDPDGSGKSVGGAWVLDAETGKGRVFWLQAQRSGLPVPAAYQEVLHRDDVDARDVFWSEQPAFGSMKGGFLHR